MPFGATIRAASLTSDSLQESAWSLIRNMSENSENPGQIIRVLLVEDHQLTRIGLKTVLERTPDIKIIGEAENGEEAVRKVGELDPDVVLMDVGMPIMDGIEAVQKIREQYQDINTIMLTS